MIFFLLKFNNRLLNINLFCISSHLQGRNWQKKEKWRRNPGPLGTFGLGKPKIALNGLNKVKAAYTLQENQCRSSGEELTADNSSSNVLQTITVSIQVMSSKWEGIKPDFDRFWTSLDGIYNFLFHSRKFGKPRWQQLSKRLKCISKKFIFCYMLY